MRFSRAAKSILDVLQKTLGIKFDLSKLDQETEKFMEIVEKCRRSRSQKETYARRMLKTEEGTAYINWHFAN